MRTVQEVIRSLNTYKLVVTYLNEYESIKFSDDEYNTFEKHQLPFFIAKLQKRCILVSRIFNYIERLKHIPVQESDDMIIAYIINDYYDKITTSLIHKQELMDIGITCEAYAYEFCTQSEILGWKLPETEFVKDYIYQIIADILFEASFFGYDQEELPAAKSELQQATEAAINYMEETHQFKSWEDVKNELGITIETDTAKDRLYSEQCRTASDYCQYCKEKELMNILQLIHNEATK